MNATKVWVDGILQVSRDIDLVGTRTVQFYDPLAVGTECDISVEGDFADAISRTDGAGGSCVGDNCASASEDTGEVDLLVVGQFVGDSAVVIIPRK